MVDHAEMKYIIFEKDGLEVPVVFPDTIYHEQVKMNGKVVSAGMCKIKHGKFEVWGKSISLLKESRLEDELILNQLTKK